MIMLPYIELLMKIITKWNGAGLQKHSNYNTMFIRLCGQEKHSYVTRLWL